MVATPFPFATVEELKARWQDFPVGGEGIADVKLEDASQLILDLVPEAVNASVSTRRRVVCAVVRRSMEDERNGGDGSANGQFTTGPYSWSSTPRNPNGEMTLLPSEMKMLGHGKQKAFSVSIAGNDASSHSIYCNLNFGAHYCSCGADIAGKPIHYEGGSRLS